MNIGNSIGDLVNDLKQQVKTFIRQEVQLAKTELSEKLSHFGRHATSVAIGGFIVYAGVIVCLIAIGLVIGYAFEQLGFNPILARFIGFAIIGFIVICVGAMMVRKGIKSIKQGSLTPQRTIQTIQPLESAYPLGRFESKDRDWNKEKVPGPSSEELEAAVLSTQGEIAETVEELADRVTLSRLRHQADVEIQNHPYRWSLVALGVGLVSAYLLERKYFRGKS